MEIYWIRKKIENQSKHQIWLHLLDSYFMVSMLIIWWKMVNLMVFRFSPLSLSIGLFFFKSWSFIIAITSCFISFISFITHLSFTYDAWLKVKHQIYANSSLRNKTVNKHSIKLSKYLWKQAIAHNGLWFFSNQHTYETHSIHIGKIHTNTLELYGF